MTVPGHGLTTPSHYETGPHPAMRLARPFIRPITWNPYATPRGWESALSYARRGADHTGRQVRPANSVRPWRPYRSMVAFSKASGVSRQSLYRWLPEGLDRTRFLQHPDTFPDHYGDPDPAPEFSDAYPDPDDGPSAGPVPEAIRTLDGHLYLRAPASTQYQGASLMVATELS